MIFSWMVSSQIKSQYKTQMKRLKEVPGQSIFSAFLIKSRLIENGGHSWLTEMADVRRFSIPGQV